MKKGEGRFTPEERRLFFERLDAWAKAPEPMPATPVVTLPVGEKIAEAVRANPGSVRVTACGADGVSVIDRPQRNSANVTVQVNMVREVDGEGRPIWPKAGVVHEYDPIARGLK